VLYRLFQLLSADADGVRKNYGTLFGPRAFKDLVLIAADFATRQDRVPSIGDVRATPRLQSEGIRDRGAIPTPDRVRRRPGSLDREVHALVWPNGADFDPATLHDWPEHEAAMIALARRWAAAGRNDKAQ